ncbi:pyridoxal phosphate-dependent decarboxylase family protein [Sphaerochaeta halotolerans]|uniref:pyridoxal phosphate-dependent decarboxylase family protein n=1 Tax=Sphaerochaeta halotolerans TaxID=2293840 RepID=UPI00136E78B9|nr:aspartate aminotransferase family protein [Sphaerochaeta halotolerans]MXI85951.1 diaminobutyrate decarboxylase [Sphaerochaeta halotolerans]
MSKPAKTLPYVLGQEQEKKDEYKRVLTETIEAITASVTDEGAYQGASVETLQQSLAEFAILPSQGIGWEALLERVKQIILPHFLKTWSPNYMAHLHSPALLESIASELIIATFNQSMDSWDQSPIATEVEVAVVQQLCNLYGYGKESDGVFTSGGSQSNLSAITMARDWYCSSKLNHDVKKEGLPASYHKLRLYTSEVSHFSMEKSAHLLGLGYDAVRKVPVDDLCRMDVQELRGMIESDKQAGLLPFCVVATIGTTDYGSIDRVEAIRTICDEEGMFLHADAAYGSGLQLSPTYRTRLGDLSLCDSITVDFHKMFLLPISCGAILVKNKEHFSVFTLHADYLNREEDEEEGYTNLVGKSLQTTRRADALKVWMAFQCRGKDGYEKIVDTCIENATFLAKALLAHPSFTLAIEPELSSVVFRHIGTSELNKRIRKELLHHHQVVIGQTVYKHKTYLKFTLLNPTITKEHLSELIALIDTLANELQQ